MLPVTNITTNNIILSDLGEDARKIYTDINPWKGFVVGQLPGAYQAHWTQHSMSLKAQIKASWKKCSLCFLKMKVSHTTLKPSSKYVKAFVL